MEIVQQSINLTFGDAVYFKEIIKALNVFSDEANFKADRDGLSHRSMDPSHIMMVDLKLPRECFDEYDIDEPVTFGLNLESLVKKVFKFTDKQDHLKLQLHGDHAEFKLISDIQRAFKTLTISLEEEAVPTPKIRYHVCIRLVLKALMRILRDATNISDQITLNMGESLTFSAEKDEDKFSVTLDKCNENVLTLQNYEPSIPQTAHYSIDYLTKFMKALKPLVDIVEISYSKDMPLQIKANIMYNGTLTFWLAPRVDGDY